MSPQQIKQLLESLKNEEKKKLRKKLNAKKKPKDLKLNKKKIGKFYICK